MHRDDTSEGHLPRRAALLTMAGVGGAAVIPQAAGSAKDQSDAVSVDRAIRGRLSESISLADFGYRGDGASDDLPAWRAALAEAARRGVGLLTVPFGQAGISLVSGSIVDGPWPVGLVIEAVGNSGLTQSYHDGVEIRYTGSGICWNCDTTGLPQQRGGSVHFYGRTTWRGLGFRCTDPAGTMFAFNEGALRDWIDRGIEPAGRCDVASFMRWESCTLLGAGSGKRQRGDAIRGALVFHSVIDEGCEIRGWRRGIHLLCSDNNNLHGRLSFCGRNAMIEGTPGGGNDNVVHGPWIGPSSISSEPSYPVWDTGKTTTLLRVTIEQDIIQNATACAYLDGANTTLIVPYMVGSPMFHLGPNLTNGMLIRPLGGRLEPRWAPLIDPPSTYDAGIVGYDRSLKIVGADQAFLANAGIHPRLRFDQSASIELAEGANIPAGGRTHWTINAFTYQGQTAGSSVGFASGPVWQKDPMNHHNGWSLRLDPTGDTRPAGWEQTYVAGQDFALGQVIHIGICSRVQSILKSGSFDIGWILNGKLQNQVSIHSPLSSALHYSINNIPIMLESVSWGDKLSIFFSLQPKANSPIFIKEVSLFVSQFTINDINHPPTANDFNNILRAMRIKKII